MRTIVLCLAAMLTIFSGLTAGAADFSKWRLYPSYNNITEIEPTGREVFVLASGGLFSYNHADGSLATYDRTTGLSDSDIRHIAWSTAAQKLVIAYTNADIDLLTADGTVENIPGLYQKDYTFDKYINDILIDGNYAYLATAFGVVKLSLRDATILDTYQLGINVNYCYISNGRLYAASAAAGTWSGSLDANLTDRNNWTRTGDFTWPTVDRRNVYDKTGNCWWTVNESGKLTAYTLDAGNQRTYKTEGVLPDGPASNNFYRLYLNNGKLYATGGLWNEVIDDNHPGEIHVYDGNKWSEFERPAEARMDSLYRDVICLAFDPRDNNHVMAGSKGGLFEFRNGKYINLYNKDNSTILNCLKDHPYTYTLVSSALYDSSGNLWILNPLHTTANKDAIRVFDSNGAWKSFSHNEFSGKSLGSMGFAFISKTNGYMWFINCKSQNQSFISAYDITSDKLYIYGPSLTNQDATSISYTYIYCIREDKEGNIWVCSDAGPFYLSKSAIDNGEDYFTQYKVPRNDGTNYADYLLGNVNILSMAVDGGNQKWFGSDNGVFLISSDNNTQIAHFTTRNSPLPSNTVYDIIINDATGEVFFSTDKGLCSYKNNVTEPSETMTKDNVYAYPNPVAPDYKGLITIVGLSYNADVKIVTPGGALVNQGRSTGGTYTWDGNDQKGNRVAAGVYMVETATADGSKGTVCKIAVIN